MEYKEDVNSVSDIGPEGTRNEKTISSGKSRGRSVQRPTLTSSSCYIPSSLPPLGQHVHNIRSENIYTDPDKRSHSPLHSFKSRRLATRSSHHNSRIGSTTTTSRKRRLQNRSLGRRYRSYTPIPRHNTTFIPVNISNNNENNIQIAPVVAVPGAQQEAPPNSTTQGLQHYCNTASPAPLPTAPLAPFTSGFDGKVTI